MNPVLVYLLLLKATATSFSGLAGVPIVHEDFVVHRHLLTVEQLNASIAVSRTIPGPNGLWIVGAGYYAAGVPGAVAGTLALMTPAFLVIPLLIWARRHADLAVVRNAISASLIAGAGLLVAITFELARSSITTPFAAGVAAVAFVAQTVTRVDTLWMMLASAVAGLIARRMSAG